MDHSNWHSRHLLHESCNLWVYSHALVVLCDTFHFATSDMLKVKTGFSLTSKCIRIRKINKNTNNVLHNQNMCWNLYYLHSHCIDHLAILTCKNIKMFCCFQFPFIITWFYYNQVVVTFRLRSRISSSHQIGIANTPLYCRKVTFVKCITTVNTVVFPWYIFFGEYMY